MSYELGEGRLVPSIAALIALAGVVVGGWALARTGRAGAERAAAAAMTAGLVSAVVGGLHAANAAGGLGTGNGLAGAVVALVLGAIATVIAGLALLRTRRRVKQG
ncbi:DUF6223 family protein [Nucisporomicrobium flavum]|uniref:DUF6223 family protein n=1 Tax=Nucisporomicrobium flavum TaxID=2785915 RepID=UPI0018F639EE|nr:DUF6223 family protein [Nucisporomicrobium flavum]